MEMDHNALERVRLELKLYINEQLYQKGHITEEMYRGAKSLILKEHPPCGIDIHRNR